MQNIFPMKTRLLHDISQLQPSASVVAVDHPMENDALVFWAQLLVPNATLNKLRDLLCEEEDARAERFKFPHLQRNYIVCRAILRQLLGIILMVDPISVPIEYNAWNKPFINMKQEQGTLKFNLSHSGHYAIYAFTWNREIGIDLERIEHKKAIESISNRYFTPNEIRALVSLPPSERLDAFYTCWTRKEAYIKAVGRGLDIPLDSFEVSVKPNEAAALTAHSRQPCELARWQLMDLSDVLPMGGFRAALAVEQGQY